MKDTLIEIKNNLQEIKSRLDEAENQLSNLKYKEAKNNQSEEQEEKRIKKYEDSVRSLWDNVKHTNISIMKVVEGEEKTRNLYEKIMTDNFLNLVKEIDIQVQKHRESQIR